MRVASAKHGVLYEMRLLVQNMPGCHFRKYGWGQMSRLEEEIAAVLLLLTALISFGLFNIFWAASLGGALILGMPRGLYATTLNHKHSGRLLWARNTNKERVFYNGQGKTPSLPHYWDMYVLQLPPFGNLYIYILV